MTAVDTTWEEKRRWGSISGVEAVQLGERKIARLAINDRGRKSFATLQPTKKQPKRQRNERGSEWNDRHSNVEGSTSPKTYIALMSLTQDIDTLKIC